MCDYELLDYSEIGAGENVLLLHGWGANKNCWGNLLDLSVDYHVWALDLWGFGNSPEPPLNANTSDFSLGVEDFIKNRIGTNVTVVGHSFGGRIALCLAQTDWVKRLILVDSAGVKPRFSLKKYLTKTRYKRLKHLVSEGRKPQAVLARFGSNDYKNASVVMRSVLVNAVNENLVNLAKKVRVPTQIIWGRYDKVTPLYMAKTLRKAIKKSRLSVVSAGHFCFLDGNILPQIYKFLESS